MPDIMEFGREDYREMCQSCLGQGYIVTCCDDLCACSDHCIHGDGEYVCPECGGSGEVEYGPGDSTF